jgi:hypothetical protein
LDYEKTRIITEEKLAGRLEGLRSGENVPALESFAKAYLGMYLDIDKSLSPEERVCLLANADICENIFLGFQAVLEDGKLPDPESIGSALAAGERYPIGYIALAGMDMLARESLDEMLKLPESTLRAALCFHLANPTELENSWFNHLMKQRPDLATGSLREFWSQIMEHGSRHVPGLQTALRNSGMLPVMEKLLIPVLQHWEILDKKMLMNLLISAFRYTDRAALLDVCRNALEHADDIPVVQHVYWLASAYLLAPGEYHDEIFEYVGRTREKAVPMLKFILPILDDENTPGIRISAKTLAHILHMLAPKFRPKRDQFGNLDDSVQMIIWLFERLGREKNQEGREAVEYLRKIRVMRIYSEYLDRAAEEQARGQV